MITPAQAMARYGDPAAERAMVLWDVPAALEVGAIPRRIYCNRDMVKPLERAFTALVAQGLAPLVKTWDGCFQIRNQHGARVLSLHAWGLAVDFNAAWNRQGKKPMMDPRIVAVFDAAGFDWGGRFKRLDGMHFQLAKFPS